MSLLAENDVESKCHFRLTKLAISYRESILQVNCTG